MFGRRWSMRARHAHRSRASELRRLRQPVSASTLLHQGCCSSTRPKVEGCVQWCSARDGCALPGGWSSPCSRNACWPPCVDECARRGPSGPTIQSSAPRSSVSLAGAGYVAHLALPGAAPGSGSAAVGAPARHQEAAQAARRLRQHQKASHIGADDEAFGPTSSGRASARWRRWPVGAWCCCVTSEPPCFGHRRRRMVRSALRIGHVGAGRRRAE